MVWSVQRDSNSDWERATDLVLVCADYELLDDSEAVLLAEGILDVAHRRAYYVSEGGGRYATREDYEAKP